MNHWGGFLELITCPRRFTLILVLNHCVLGTRGYCQAVTPHRLQDPSTDLHCRFTVKKSKQEIPPHVIAMCIMVIASQKIPLRKKAENDEQVIPSPSTSDQPSANLSFWGFFQENWVQIPLTGTFSLIGWFFVWSMIVEELSSHLLVFGEAECFFAC